MRLYVWLEDADYLIKDLEQAFGEDVVTIKQAVQ